MKLYNNPEGRRSVDIDLNEMKRLRAQGYTIGQLAEHFEVSKTTITDRLKREGLTLADITPDDVTILKGKRIHHFDLEEVKRLRAMGYSVARIARELGVPLGSIYNRLRTAGLTIADITPGGVEVERFPDRPNIDLEELKRLRAQGYTVRQLAEHFGVGSPTPIVNLLKREGLTLADITPDDVTMIWGRIVPHFDLEEVKRLRAQGYTIGQLAEHFEVSKATITNRLKREGLTLADVTPDGVNISPGRRVHQIDLEEVKRLRAMGYGMTRIARELGVPAPAIYSRLKTAGLTLADITPEGVNVERFSEEGRNRIASRKRIDIDLDELKRLRAQGYTIGQLAEHFGVAPNTITNRLTREGLTLADITPDEVNILPGSRIHHFDLEEVKRLRAMGYGATRIARELGVPVGRIYSRLKTAGLTIADITPEGVEAKRFSEENRYRTDIDLEELKRLRAQGYTIGQLAEHFGVSATAITNRLKREGLTLADITPEGVKVRRNNPLQTQGSAMSKTVGFGIGATATTALDYTLKKTTEFSSTKRHLISGGTTTVVGLGVYATTKREDALWSAYGSIFATVGHLIYDKVKGK